MFRDLFRSKGMKRNIACVLAVVATIGTFFPGVAEFMLPIYQAAGVLGAVGVGQAVVTDNVEISQ